MDSRIMILNPVDNQPLGREFFIITTFFIIEYLTRSKSNFSERYIWLQIIILSLAITLLAPPAMDLSFIYFQF